MASTDNQDGWATRRHARMARALVWLDQHVAGHRLWLALWRWVVRRDARRGR